MKKMIFLVFMILLVLSGCEDSLKYTNTGITLDGNDIYYYETNTEICITLYSTTLQLSEDIQYEVMYNCNFHHVVLLNGEYIPLTTYINNNLVSIEDLLNSNLGGPIYYDSILSILDIDINDFLIDRIIIRTLNGEFKKNGGEWTESTKLTLQSNTITGYISELMYTKVEENDVCNNNMCVIQGNISPGTIYLKNGDNELRINFYGNRYQIFYEDDNSIIGIYGITKSSENELLMDTIMEVYNNLD